MQTNVVGAADLTLSVRKRFADTFGRAAALVGRAPGRVNLIGEHTDYNAGLCLPIALRQATFAAVAPTTDGSIRMASAGAPEPWTGRIEDLSPGSVDGWAAYPAGVLWALREAGWEVPGVEVMIDSTVPSGAGLSSSAALECSVAVAVAALVGAGDDDAVRRTLVGACIRAEAEMAGAPTGGLDQTASLLAEADHALRLDFADATVRSVPLPLAAAGLGILVIDTGVSHSLNDGGYAQRVAECARAADALGVATLREATLARVDELEDAVLRHRARHVVTEIARVDLAVDAMSAGDWRRLGELFVASHESLRDDYQVSAPELDVAVEVAVGAGALGARMTGGGFGGSAIALVAADRTDAVTTAVQSAFAGHGFGAPGMLLADAGPAAGVVHP